MSKTEYRNELINSMRELSKYGYICRILNETPGFLYGYIITPSDNIIYVQRDSFEWRGWTFSLEYPPTSKNGTGCGCLEEPVNSITVEIMEQAEKEGLVFAKSLGAKLYKSSAEWLKGYWQEGALSLVAVRIVE